MYCAVRGTDGCRLRKNAVDTCWHTFSTKQREYREHCLLLLSLTTVVILLASWPCGEFITALREKSVAVRRGVGADVQQSVRMTVLYRKDLRDSARGTNGYARDDGSVCCFPKGLTTCTNVASQGGMSRTQSRQCVRGNPQAALSDCRTVG